MKKISVSKIFIYLILTVFGFLMVYPFLSMTLGSFKTNAEIMQMPPTFFPENATMANYENVLAKNNFGQYFMNSLGVAVIKTSLTLYTSALFGYVFCKLEFRGRNALFMVVLATMMIPWPVTITPMYQMMTWFKWVDTWTALIVPSAINTFGVFMMRQFMDSIPNDLLEAARIDGAGEFRIFHTIMLPNLTASISALGIFQFLGVWDDYLWPFLMLNDSKMYTLPIGLSLFNGQYAADNGSIFASATVAVIPVIIVYLMFQKRFVEGIAMTGLKG